MSSSRITCKDWNILKLSEMFDTLADLSTIPGGPISSRSIDRVERLFFLDCRRQWHGWVCQNDNFL